MANEPCLGFGDLFQAAHGRDMTPQERAELGRLRQPERNEWVRREVALTGNAIVCEDRLGTDGVTYTAFWRAGSSDEPCVAGVSAA
jgi:hypothetical protein